MGHPRISAVLLALAIALAPGASAVQLEFNAFGDFTAGENFGGPADDSQGDSFRTFGATELPYNLNDGFGIVGTDFVVTAHLTDDLTYQGEINFQVDRGSRNEIEIDPERFYLDYAVSDALNFQAGLYFTPIGYHNRFLYSRAWLLYSIQIPDLFEEELNLMPTHTVGINVHGTLEPFGQTFRYILGVGNARGDTPDETIYARQPFDDGVEVTALLEWQAPIEDTLIVGLSAWTSRIETSLVPSGVGSSVDPDTAPTVRMQEVGFIPYVTYYGRHFNMLLEGFYAELHDDGNDLPKDQFSIGGLTAEVSLNFLRNTLHPYVRYDFTRLPSPGDDPYYSLRDGGGTIDRVFLSEMSAFIFGAAYDLNAHARLKTEAIYNFHGARDRWGLQAQIAFGF